MKKEDVAGAALGRATVGKLFGVARAMKGGVGASRKRVPDSTIVGALVVVNAFGDILDIATGRIIAGARCAEDSLVFADTRRLPSRQASFSRSSAWRTPPLAVVATNAQVNKVEMTKVAQWPRGDW